MNRYHHSTAFGTIAVSYKHLYPNISVDFGVLDKPSNVYMMKCDFGWADLGTWHSIYAVSYTHLRGGAFKRADYWFPTEGALKADNSANMNVPKTPASEEEWNEIKLSLIHIFSIPTS